MVQHEGLELRVCIAGVEVPEFLHAGVTYVECNLFHQSSYKVALHEGGDEEHVAKWPVTPYTVQIHNHRDMACWATLFVDGCRISRHLLQPSASKVIEGIDDGAHVKELLFSFPRLVSHEADRLSNERLAAVGTIRIEHQVARDGGQRMMVGRGSDFDATNFVQANKKDAHHAASNSTTRMGKVVRSHRGHSRSGSSAGTKTMHHIWHREGPVHTVELKYRMRHGELSVLLLLLLLLLLSCRANNDSHLTPLLHCKLLALSASLRTVAHGVDTVLQQWGFLLDPSASPEAVAKRKAARDAAAAAQRTQAAAAAAVGDGDVVVVAERPPKRSKNDM